MKTFLRLRDPGLMLTRAYYIKSHLSERLHELSTISEFATLSSSLNQVVTQLETEITQADELLEAENIEFVFEECASLMDFLENAYSAIHYTEKLQKGEFLSLLFYLECADGILSATSDQIVEFSEICKLESIPKYLLYTRASMSQLIMQSKSNIN